MGLESAQNEAFVNLPKRLQEADGSVIGRLRSRLSWLGNTDYISLLPGRWEVTVYKSCIENGK